MGNTYTKGVVAKKVEVEVFADDAPANRIQEEPPMQKTTVSQVNAVISAPTICPPGYNLDRKGICRKIADL